MKEVFAQGGGQALGESSLEKSPVLLGGRNAVTPEDEFGVRRIGSWLKHL